MKIKDKYRFILDNSNDSILLFEKSKLVYASKTFYEITGYNEKDFSNSTIETFFMHIHPDDRELTRSKFQKGLTNQLQFEKHNFRFITKKGNYIWICNRANRFYDIEGKPEYIVLNCQDITESIKNEKILNERLKFEKAISNVSTALLTNKKDAVSIALNNILMVSKACRIYIFENFFDSKGDLCMKQIHEICAEDIEPEINNPVLQKVSYRYDGFIRWKNTLSKNKMLIGDIRDFPDAEQKILKPQQIKSILILPIPANNQWFGFIGFDYTKKEKSWSEWDINLLKTASEILGAYFQNRNNLSQIKKQNEVLQKLNKDKDQFMQILAHDLKNPFNNLIGFTELLKRNFDRYDKEKTKKLISIISEVSNNTYNLLTDLLLWSQSQSGKLHYQPEKISFQEIGAEVIKELYFLAEEKRIELNYFDNNQTIIQVDVNMFKTVLRNLITNAIKFTYRKGKINVYTSFANNQTTIVVSDTGIGISKADIKKLWDYRNPHTTQGTNNEQGTGLGLILCKELIEKHGGTIWVESEVGKGTDFKFTIDHN